MNEPEFTGIPAVDALIEVAGREYSQFWALASVSDAEGTVSKVRGTDLTEQQAAARRRGSAAKRRLTWVQKDGERGEDRRSLQALRCCVRRVRPDLRVVIQELRGVVAAGLDRNDQMLGRMRRSWDAGSVVIDALSPKLPRRRTPIGFTS
ncbi:hypothetical protein [Nocardia sp. alder85J]|uniref:hypothetical protein n=1 Tax=Nocardia sp. alder85J TaxID=2862949 RepID=UPI001CD349BD|nr:hypothetical protein [Nocardia sp. alder85J]MCX4097779.1 hypothetical protein [Nocardia sp. alder85J]